MDVIFKDRFNTDDDTVAMYIDSFRSNAIYIINSLIPSANIKKKDGTFYEKDKNVIRSWIRYFYNQIDVYCEEDFTRNDEKLTLINHLPTMKASHYKILIESILSSYTT